MRWCQAWLGNECFFGIIPSQAAGVSNAPGTFLFRHTLRSFPHRSWIVINRQRTHTVCLFVVLWSLLLSMFLCTIFRKSYLWVMDGTIVSASSTSDSEHLPLPNKYVFACCFVPVLSKIWKRTRIALWLCEGFNQSTAQDPDMTHGPEMENHQKFRCGPKMQYPAGE